MPVKSNAVSFMPEDPPSAEKLRDLLHRLHGFQPRPDQVEAIKTLAIDQRDLILIARTGWGKSMIFQSVPALRTGGIALLIMPLNLLEEDQAASIKKISGCVPCILNSKSNNAHVRQRIMNGEFTHILLGPEIALSDKFAELLRHREFHQRLVLVAIDELHVVQQWGGDWRKHYSRIGVLRHRIDKRVPWFGTSATLDPTMLQDVIQLAGFQDEVEVMKTTIDRPDISLSIRRIEHSIASFHDLSFLLDEAVTAPGQVSMSQIPKTIVYMDSIAQIEAAEFQMIEWLVRLGSQRALASAAIQAYHSQLADFDKRRISEDFCRPDRGQGGPAIHRIILATDAMGMGIDNPDIRRVIQWKQPSSMCTLFQRAGRAARGSGYMGDFLWLVDSWCFEPMENQADASRRAKLERVRRAQLDPGLRELINTRGCIRKCALNFFGESMTDCQRPGPLACCTGCSQVDILPRPRKQEQQLRKSKVPNWARLRARTDLIQWRKTRAAQLFHASFFQDEDAHEALMPTHLLDNLARDGYHIHTINDLRDRIGGSGFGWRDLEGRSSRPSGQLGLPRGSTSEPLQLLVQLKQETRDKPFNSSMQTGHSVRIEVSHRLRQVKKGKKGR
ncbi:P-loop containing nucleoside triphosphate hydrolase protein [Penicillium canescens]|uniref:DNA 3'-5' helicase n=1 Tax=Penicillium canescens TaxID=5083 RepID=A0AAD6IBK4_PENCN|nr:P-loop containing nucleoside triphosphate hydrolase protein [Penicillium canescens]XP_058378803.1 P-loop containing nucleoside triphosphate hydrolase protein [Penicillium canescens]KAJ6041554.1 P-loop containing nucleoside triphosphate hydrolase protein [Penicillium canescens]KAJ6050455.1 P-loop containing nucleoside triphosphate hydrolase protein [Penicillium canescens]KAJ6065944.1 P-loop containing nucleoside triphosphate hydrolase protein [Penicillium canescens]KAJ6065966.1 P-loop contai